MAMPSPAAVTPAGSATWDRVVIPAAIGPGARPSRTHVVLGVRLAAPQEADRQRRVGGAGTPLRGWPRPTARAADGAYRPGGPAAGPAPAVPERPVAIRP